MQTLLIASVSLIAMTGVYAIIKACAEAWDNYSLKHWQPPEGIGTKKDGTPVFDD